MGQVGQTQIETWLRGIKHQEDFMTRRVIKEFLEPTCTSECKDLCLIQF